jgi:predicted RNase H-like nuclease
MRPHLRKDPAVRVAGVDGTRGGWVVVLLDDGRLSGADVLPLDATFAELDDVRVVAIDVPIGFGPRGADAAARSFLTGATNTVFSTPPRELLERPFGPGLGISAQAHALGTRILHVTELASSDSRIFEVHPEVSFRVMNDGRPLGRKKSAGGALKRIDLLSRHGIELTDLGSATLAPLDDVLDAAAAAWSAERIAAGTARSLPDPPEVADDRAIAIWY